MGRKVVPPHWEARYRLVAIVSHEGSDSTLHQGMTAAEATEYVRSGKQSKTVQADKQNARVRGTKAWDRREEKEKRRGGLQSEVTVSVGRVHALVEEFCGTGEMYVRNGNPPQLKEVMRACGNIIGVRSDPHRESAPTDSFTIHCSKDGVHIVPAAPSWEEK